MERSLIRNKYEKGNEKSKFEFRLWFLSAFKGERKREL